MSGNKMTIEYVRKNNANYAMEVYFPNIPGPLWPICDLYHAFRRLLVYINHPHFTCTRYPFWKLKPMQFSDPWLPQPLNPKQLGISMVYLVNLSTVSPRRRTHLPGCHRVVASLHATVMVQNIMDAAVSVPQRKTLLFWPWPFGTFGLKSLECYGPWFYKWWFVSKEATSKIPSPISIL